MEKIKSSGTFLTIVGLVLVAVSLVVGIMQGGFNGGHWISLFCGLGVGVTAWGIWALTYSGK